MFGAPKPTFGGFGGGTTFGATTTPSAFGGASTGLFGSTAAGRGLQSESCISVYLFLFKIRIIVVNCD